MDPQLIRAIQSVAEPNRTSVAQAIGALGTLLVSIIGFLVLIRQLKQFNQNMQYDAYSKNIDDYSRLTQLLIEKPHLNKFFYSANAEFGKLKDEEKDFYNYIGLSLGFLERLFTLYKKGWIDQVSYGAWERWFTEQWFSLEVFKVFWEKEGKYFNEDFTEEMNKKYLAYVKPSEVRV